MKHRSKKLLAGLLVAGVFAIGAVKAPGASILVLNPSFESNSNGGDGYGAITSWAFSGAGARGTSTVSQAFASGTVIPDFSQVGFIHGQGTLSQPLSGLDTTKQYWFQVFYGERYGYGKPTMDVTYGGQTLVSSATFGAVNQTTASFLNIPFTPASASATLSVKSMTSWSPTDNALLLDGISVIQRDAGQVVIRNPSFEGSQASAASGGVSPAIAGWVTSGTVGVNPVVGGGNPYGVPTVLDGVEAALLEGSSSLSQILPGLVSGQWYELSLYGARQSGDAPTLSLSVGTHTLTTDFAGLTTDFALYSYTFLADASDVAGPTLLLRNSSSTAGYTLFLDNVMLGPGEPAIPEPSTVLLFGLGGLPLYRRRRARKA